MIKKNTQDGRILSVPLRSPLSPYPQRKWMTLVNYFLGCQWPSRGHILRDGLWLLFSVTCIGGLRESLELIASWLLKDGFKKKSFPNNSLKQTWKMDSENLAFRTSKEHPGRPDEIWSIDQQRLIIWLQLKQCTLSRATLPYISIRINFEHPPNTGPPLGKRPLGSSCFGPTILKDTWIASCQGAICDNNV